MPRFLQGLCEAFGGSGYAAAKRMCGRYEDDLIGGQLIPFRAKVEC